MPRHSISNRTSNTTIANPCLEIIAGATTKKVVEVSITIDAATASVFGIGYAAAQGVTPTTPATVVPEDKGRAAIDVKTALAWATPPTVPTAFLRRVNIPATAGAVRTFTFPEGIALPPSTSLVVWNITATSAADIDVVVAG